MSRSAKVLIVDDEELIRLNLRALLEDLGYTVIEAANGREGLATFDREIPDLVLADLRMPVMDGQSMIVSLKEKQPDTPVVVVSGTGTVQDAVGSLRHGAWDYILKPVTDIEAFSIVIARALEKAQLIKENRRYQEHLEEIVQERTKELHYSEARYRRLLESVSSYVYTVTFKDGHPDKTVHRPGCEAVTGYTPEEYTADPHLWHRMIVDEDRLFTAEMVQRIFNENLSLSFEHRLSHRDGTVRWVQNTLVPHRTAAGELLSYDGIIVDITERKEAEARLSQATERWARTFDAVPDLITILDTDYNIVQVNKAMADRLGRTAQDCAGQTCYSLVHGTECPISCCPQKLTLLDKQEHVAEMHEPRLGGDFIVSTSPIQDAAGVMIGSVHVARDITERKRAEQEKEKLQLQFLQAQKMESVGRLAGGVAHDFNNMLGIIIGYTDMALEQVDPGQPLFAKLQQILNAAQRSVDLTRQLLAFARKQTISPRVLDLNESIESMLNLLRRLIGENIGLAWLPGKKLWPVKMDPAQIDQILANLCVNARDAISGVGKITIETGKATLDGASCSDHPGFQPGDYVLLAVNDDGQGMAKQTLDRIFEPFFTTKGMGKGTGLGLATVYGIIKQNNGYINVSSEPGHGTSFRIYLPRSRGPAVDARKETAAKTPLNRGETVLIVEDEPEFLRMAGIMMENLGFQVLTAGTSGEAVALAEQHTGEIQLLLTDVIMPEMSGRALAERLQSFCPAMKVLFVSGYTSDVIIHQGVLDEGVNFIQKPFSLRDLAVKLQEILMKK